MRARSSLPRGRAPKPKMMHANTTISVFAGLVAESSAGMAREAVIPMSAPSASAPRPNPNTTNDVRRKRWVMSA